MSTRLITVLFAMMAISTSEIRLVPLALLSPLPIHEMIEGEGHKRKK